MHFAHFGLVAFKIRHADFETLVVKVILKRFDRLLVTLIADEINPVGTSLAWGSRWSVIGRRRILLCRFDFRGMPRRYNRLWKVRLSHHGNN